MFLILATDPSKKSQMINQRNHKSSAPTLTPISSADLTPSSYPSVSHRTPRIHAPTILTNFVNRNPSINESSSAERGFVLDSNATIDKKKGKEKCKDKDKGEKKSKSKDKCKDDDEKSQTPSTSSRTTPSSNPSLSYYPSLDIIPFFPSINVTSLHPYSSPLTMNPSRDTNTSYPSNSPTISSRSAVSQFPSSHDSSYPTINRTIFLSITSHPSAISTASLSPSTSYPSANPTTNPHSSLNPNTPNVFSPSTTLQPSLPSNIPIIHPSPVSVTSAPIVFSESYSGPLIGRGCELIRKGVRDVNLNGSHSSFEGEGEATHTIVVSFTYEVITSMTPEEIISSDVVDHLDNDLWMAVTREVLFCDDVDDDDKRRVLQKTITRVSSNNRGIVYLTPNTADTTWDDDCGMFVKLYDGQYCSRVSSKLTAVMVEGGIYTVSEAETIILKEARDILSSGVFINTKKGIYKTSFVGEVNEGGHDDGGDPSTLYGNTANKLSFEKNNSSLTIYGTSWLIIMILGFIALLILVLRKRETIGTKEAEMNSEPKNTDFDSEARAYDSINYSREDIYYDSRSKSKGGDTNSTYSVNRSGYSIELTKLGELRHNLWLKQTSDASLPESNNIQVSDPYISVMVPYNPQYKNSTHILSSVKNEIALPYSSKNACEVPNQCERQGPTCIHYSGVKPAMVDNPLESNILTVDLPQFRSVSRSSHGLHRTANTSIL